MSFLPPVLKRKADHTTPALNKDRPPKRHRSDGRISQSNSEGLLDGMPPVGEMALDAEMSSEELDVDPFHCEPFHDQEPAFATGAAYDPVGEAKSTQGAVDPMETHAEGGTSFSVPAPHHNGGSAFREATFHELQGISTVIYDENVKLGRQLNACVDTIVSRVLDKIGSVEDALNQKLASFETQLLELRHLVPSPMDGVGEKFGLLVKAHAEKMLYSRNGGPLSSLKLDVPEAVEVLDFSAGYHPGPTSDRLRINPTSGPNSWWNLRACQVFAQDFFAARYPDTEGKTFMDASYEFYELLPTFSSHHAVASGFPDIQSYTRFQELLTKHIRRHRLTKSRLKAANEVQDLRGFLPIIRHLAEEDGMSSDERDVGEDRSFNSIRPFWRHPLITDWLQNIDSIGNGSANTTTQYQVKRQKSSKVDGESRVVRGLPVNFYDVGYLNTLDKSQYLDLDPKPAVSLEFSDSVRRVSHGDSA